MRVLKNFSINDTVVLVNNSQLTFVVTDIDGENGLIVCSISGMPEIAGIFKPEELRKVESQNPLSALNYQTD